MRARRARPPASGSARRRPPPTAPSSCARKATGRGRPLRRPGQARAPPELSFEEQVRTFDTQIAQQAELTDKLKDGLNKLRLKREELVQKRDELVSRAKMAQAQMQVQQTLKEVSVLDPTSELNRFEERIRRQEAQARGMEEVGVVLLEDQFAELESGEDELEVETRLAELKGRTLPSGAPALSSGGSGA